MGILGYIVSKNKVSNILPYIKVVSSFEQINDKTLPILIVGLEEAKRHASSFSILEKRLSDNMFWTFGKREKRVDYERDVEMFQNFIIRNVKKQIKYYYLNLFKLKQEKIKQIFRILKNNEKKIVFIEKNMIYLYYKNYILGVSKEILKYVSINPQKIVKKIEKNENNQIVYGNIDFNVKLKQLIGDKTYLFTYFLSLK